MKRDMDLVWEMIGHDPLLSLELSAIERRASSEEELVCSLIAFYARIDKIMKLASMIAGVEERFPQT